jgi:hypothetical protein
LGKEEPVNTKVLVIDGDKFDIFDPIIDAGATGIPHAGFDGVFSLALSTESDELKSGAYFLLENKKEQVASVYMESFQ